MRLSIDHRTRYHFSEPQNRVVQLARMTPLDHAGQTIIKWQVSVDRDARTRQGRDGYGNVTTMLYIDGPLEALEITVHGEVLTGPNEGLVSGAVETLPPLFYLRSTQLTAITPQVHAFATQVCGNLKDPANRAQMLNVALFERVKLRHGRSPKTRTADETLAQGWGNVRDCTQLLVTAARAAGLPARFVSGHSLDGHKIAGQKSAHCWAEIYIDEQGWVGFDPAIGRPPGEMHVRVAVGLDARDATPLSGTRTGGGIEVLDVDVKVKRRGEQ